MRKLLWLLVLPVIGGCGGRAGAYDPSPSAKSEPTLQQKLTKEFQEHPEYYVDK